MKGSQEFALSTGASGRPTGGFIYVRACPPDEFQTIDLMVTTSSKAETGNATAVDSTATEGDEPEIKQERGWL